MHQNFKGHLASHTVTEEPEEGLPGDDLKMEDTTTHNQIISLDLDTKPDHNQDLFLPTDTKRIKLSSTTFTANIVHQSSLKSRLIGPNNPDLRPESVESIPVLIDLRDDELRIPINLDIISGNIHLTDRFEWEIRELNNSPEDFVEVHVNDLGLAGEFNDYTLDSGTYSNLCEILNISKRESTVKRHVASVVRPVVAVESLYPIENLNVLFVILYPFKESKWLPPIRTIMMRGVGRPLTAPSRTITTRDGGMDWESMGLHDSMIDGVWNCGNCGCPDQIAIDRWKGLGGKDTLVVNVALIQEMVENFSSRLKYLGIQVGELTGDRQMMKDQITMTQIIVTIPEKWDVITRKSTDTSYTDWVVLITDEIHLLHDEQGPVLEALLCRHGTLLMRQPEKGLFFFDSSARPCPLKLEFIGITEKKAIKRLQLTNEICYDKATKQLDDKQQIIIFVHFRSDTTRIAKNLKETSIERDEVGKYMSGGLATREILMETAENLRDPGLKDILQFIIGIHHTGLERMLGRAGRPQYDTYGEGIIITNHSELQFHLSITKSQLPIEPQLVRRLAGILNAEIVLGTIRNQEEAAQWLGYTYWYQCALNTLHSMDSNMTPMILSCSRTSGYRSHRFCILEKSDLAKYDRKTGLVSSLELGKIASYYYVTNTSMSTYNQHLRPTMTLIELFRVFAASDEFKYVPTRPEEKQELAKLLEKVPIPFKESVGNPSAKINVLIQAYISRLPLEGFALMADMVYTTQSAGLRALFEICLKRVTQIAQALVQAIPTSFRTFQARESQLSPHQPRPLYSLSTSRLFRQIKVDTSNISTRSAGSKGPKKELSEVIELLQQVTQNDLSQTRALLSLMVAILSDTPKSREFGFKVLQNGRIITQDDLQSLKFLRFEIADALAKSGSLKAIEILAATSRHSQVALNSIELTAVPLERLAPQRSPTSSPKKAQLDEPSMNTLPSTGLEGWDPRASATSSDKMTNRLADRQLKFRQVVKEIIQQMLKVGTSSREARMLFRQAVRRHEAGSNGKEALDEDYLELMHAEFQLPLFH
ncbi:hypothetical protein H4Q26_005168 [Puccinia striiformis f. sp. tritici PST-130]|nr:hypothetical protein H4Q26_005168 [Puccinia striiformis f. sp. tritici PST-130]